MSKIVSLHGEEPVVSGAPVRCVVEMLQDLLARAERGEIAAAAIAAVNANRATITEWTESGGYRNDIAASVMVLHARVSSALSED